MGKQNIGRYQVRQHILTNCEKIGIAMQIPVITGAENLPKDFYLKVESQFDKDESNEVEQRPKEVNKPVAQVTCPHAAKA